MSNADPNCQLLAHMAGIIQDGQAEPTKALQRILTLACSHRLEVLTQYLLDRCGPVVQSGPFAGMKYVTRSVGSVLPAKLLGCYEAELHGIMAAIVREGYERILNIGCGEGYYAVGLARLLPTVMIYAFDSNVAAQNLCREVAERNGMTDRLTIRGECRPADLQQLIQGRALVFCDCEGGEAALLDPRPVPELRTCDVLVEAHEFLDPAIRKTLEDWFCGTHAVIRVDHSGRDPNTVAALRGLSQLDQYLAVWEGRPGPTPWLFLRAHALHR